MGYEQVVQMTGLALELVLKLGKDISQEPNI
jgi:hypothetical protein